jgi:exopolyphosphatase/guanosine-5'-triphosphate,3'-diphosphate pyrophosphatase
MDAAVEAFETFRDRIEALQIGPIRAVATSAVREARNGNLLVDRILRRTGIELEVITGTEEARLVHLAVASRIDLRGRQWILVDLGGGSVEISLADDAGMLWTESHTMGSVRLLEVVSEGVESGKRLRALLEEYVSVLRIPDPAQYWKPGGLIATGGNIEALARLAAAPVDDAGVAHLAVKDLEASVQLLTRLSYTERVQRLNLREDRADVILPAALVYLRLAKVADMPTLLVPHVGVREGVVLDLVDRHTDPEPVAVRGAQQLIQSTISLGRRFMFNEVHAVHVARLALQLFDALERLHGLGGRDRQLLQVAALLHDIGAFIESKRHHRHSLYLISRSELPGLSADETLFVANVARYHRKSHPQPHHTEYMQLTRSARARVDQLAGILRIADAMDRQHLQRVERATLRPEGLSLRITLHGEGDCLLERWAINRKKGLFEETFGLTVQVDP